MKILSVAANGIQEQLKRLEASAVRTATISTKVAEGKETVDLVAETVERIDATAQTKANLAVIKTEDERLKHLLDVIA